MIRLSSEAEALLDQGIVNPISELWMGNPSDTPPRPLEVIPDVLSFSVSFSKKFGAASLTFILENSDAKYSEGGAKEVKFGDHVELYQGLSVNGSEERFAKFFGYIRQVNPKTEGGVNQLVVTCLDRVIRLEDMEIEEYFREGEVKAVSYEELKLNSVWTEVTPRETVILSAVGGETFVALPCYPVKASPVPKIYKNDVLLTEGPDYSIDLSSGIVTFTFELLFEDQIKADWRVENKTILTAATGTEFTLQMPCFPILAGSYDISKAAVSQIAALATSGQKDVKIPSGHAERFTAGQSVVLSPASAVQETAEIDSITDGGVGFDTLRMKDALTNTHNSGFTIDILLAEPGDYSLNLTTGLISFTSHLNFKDSIRASWTVNKMVVLDSAAGGERVLSLKYFPVKPESYSIYKNESILIETTDYSLDLDSGTIVLTAPLVAGDKVEADYTFGNLSQVFDFAHTSIAPKPPPSITIEHRQYLRVDPLWTGFQINYEQGQLIMGTPLNVNDYRVLADYHYYDKGLHLEDVIKDLITTPDGYGNTVFSESDVSETFLNLEGTATDYLTPNLTVQVIDGVTYEIGQLWFLSYNNVKDDLTAGDFTIPGGTFDSFDKRYGRVRLTAAIPPDSEVTCDVNYNFFTLQATGIQIPFIRFVSKDTKNRFEALNTIRNFVAPNYIIRTIGTKKIFANYLHQKPQEDYELKVKTGLSYAEDQDVYTRVKMFGENANPQNLMLLPETKPIIGEYYTGHAVDQELYYIGQEGDFFLYGPNPAGITGFRRFLNSPRKPLVYLDGSEYPVNHEEPVEAKQGGTLTYYKFDAVKENERIVEFHFGEGVAASKPIYIYRGAYDVDNLIRVLPPNDPNVDYARGIWSIPPYIPQAELVSYQSAIYWRDFSNLMEIDWDRNLFKIHKERILADVKINVALSSNGTIASHIPSEVGPVASNSNDGNYLSLFYMSMGYWSGNSKGNEEGWFMLDFNDKYFIAGVKAAPPQFSDTKTNWVSFPAYTELQIDRGEGAGWETKYKFPEVGGHFLRADWVFNFEEALSVKRVRMWNPALSPRLAQWNGIYRFAEFEVWGFRGPTEKLADFYYEAKALVPAEKDFNKLRDGNYATRFQTVFYVKPLKGFHLLTIDLGSVQDIDAIDMISDFYWTEDEIARYDIKNWFTLQYSLDGISYYTIAKGTNNFALEGGQSISFEKDILGEDFQARFIKILLEDSSMVDIGAGRWVVSLVEFAIYRDTILTGEAKLKSTPPTPAEEETYLYDVDGLLKTVGDKLYKDTGISKYFNTQALINRRAKSLLQEFYKNHTKVVASALARPDALIGDTARVKDDVNGVNRIYFLEEISSQQDGKVSAQLAFYP